MQVLFKRWSVEATQRTDVAVNPERVDAVTCISEVQPVRAAVWTGDPKYKFDELMDCPACTNIIMKNKQEFWVQGTVAEVVAALNGGKNAKG